jgi:hypothetical protein
MSEKLDKYRNVFHYGYCELIVKALVFIYYFYDIIYDSLLISVISMDTTRNSYATSQYNNVEDN